MKEVLNIHVGQAGIQIGYSIWELFTAEHGILRDGTMRDSNNNETDFSFNTFFSESHIQRFVPRALFIDLEPTVVNQMRTGSYAQLFHPHQLISCNEDSAGNFSRAFNTVGRILYNFVQNQLRYQIEACDNLQTVLFYKSLGGGCGSGFSALMYEMLEEYAKKARLEFPIHPSPHLDATVVSPYNTILGEHFTIEDTDIGFLMDNEALFDLTNDVMSLKKPTMTSINRILAQVASNVTAASRFHNFLFNDLNYLVTNLVPYPRIHFPLVSYAPLCNASRLERDNNSIRSITKAVFDNSHQIVKCDPTTGKYMSCSLTYRGAAATSEIYEAISQIKVSRRIKFVDWCPTGFKVGIIDSPPLMIPESMLGESKINVVMLTNCSSVSCIWQRIAHRFHRLYSKRSFVHWFVGEGLEESEFCEALYNMATLAKDYEEVSIDTKLLKSDMFDRKGEGEGGENSGTKITDVSGGEGDESETKESESGDESDDEESGDDDDSHEMSNVSNVNLTKSQPRPIKKRNKSLINSAKHPQQATSTFDSMDIPQQQEGNNAQQKTPSKITFVTSNNNVLPDNTLLSLDSSSNLPLSFTVNCQTNDKEISNNLFSDKSIKFTSYDVLSSNNIVLSQCFNQHERESLDAINTNSNNFKSNISSYQTLTLKRKPPIYIKRKSILYQAINHLNSSDEEAELLSSLVDRTSSN